MHGTLVPEAKLAVGAKRVVGRGSEMRSGSKTKCGYRLGTSFWTETQPVHRSSCFLACRCWVESVIYNLLQLWYNNPWGINAAIDLVAAFEHATTLYAWRSLGGLSRLLWEGPFPMTLW